MKKILYVTLACLCLIPGVTTPMALVAGLLFSLIWGNPWPQRTATCSQMLLKMSVVGLGFGLSVGEVWNVGKHSAGYTLVGILLTIGVGLLLGRMMKLQGSTAALISCGTAICGGSAIAAMAPVLNSKNDETVIALATVFTLNAIALILYPVIGHLGDLNQHQFGIWAGMAIHDTSSVVGAASSYGVEALQTGITVKLTRAAWIAPVAMSAALAVRSAGRVTFPLFILGFVAAALVNSLLPQFNNVWLLSAAVAKQSLVLTLFLVGAGLNRSLLRSIGVRPLLHGSLLWLIVSAVTLGCVNSGLIN